MTPSIDMFAATYSASALKQLRLSFLTASHKLRRWQRRWRRVLSRTWSAARWLRRTRPPVRRFSCGMGGRRIASSGSPASACRCLPASPPCRTASDPFPALYRQRGGRECSSAICQCLGGPYLFVERSVPFRGVVVGVDSVREGMHRARLSAPPPFVILELATRHHRMLRGLTARSVAAICGRIAARNFHERCRFHPK